MFVNTKAAYKFAEECAARKKAVKEREERSSGEFTEEMKSGDSDTVSVRSESTWLSDRNEKSKSEAMTMIEETIKMQELRKIAIAELIEHNTQIGSARLDSSNNRGTPYASKKLVSCLLQLSSLFANSSRPRILSYQVLSCP